MTRTEARQLLDESMSEKDWQQQVVEYADAMNWLIFHDRDSRGNAAGLPDLILARQGRLVLAELKSESGRVRPAQKVWLEALGPSPQTAVRLWRPSMWSDVEKVLR